MPLRRGLFRNHEEVWRSEIQRAVRLHQAIKRNIYLAGHIGKFAAGRQGSVGPVFLELLRGTDQDD